MRTQRYFAVARRANFPRTLFFSTALAVSACGGGGSTSSTTEVAPLPAPPPAPAPTPTPSPSPDVAPPKPLTGITEFHWGVKEAFDARVYRIGFRFQDASECSFTEGMAQRQDALGVQNVSVIIDADEGFQAGSSRESEVVYVRPSPLPQGEAANEPISYTSGNRGEFSGERVLTFVSKGQQPFSGGLLPGFSYAISVTCDRPFDVLNAEIGSEASILATEELDGWSAGSLFVGSAANVTGSLATFALNSGVYISTIAREQAGTLNVTHPAGELNEVLGQLAETVLFHLPSGAGTYRFEISRAAVQEDFWIAAYGLEQPLDLQLGLLMKSPFAAP